MEENANYVNFVLAFFKVAGLSEIATRSADEVMRLLQRGNLSAERLRYFHYVSIQETKKGHRSQQQPIRPAPGRTLSSW